MVLSLQNISKSYGFNNNKIEILNGCNLDVKEQEMVALIGPSGSGKSTLLYTAGLLDTFQKGEVVIYGKKTSKLNDTEKTKLRLNNIGFIYQQHNLFADFTALENVMLPMIIKGEKKEAAIKKATEKLKLMELEKRINHRPAELSGGEQQRVAIARSLANNPKLLLGDEPTGNLDPYNAELVLHLLLNLVRNTKITALIATHNPYLASQMTRKVALVSGKLYDFDNIEDLKFLKTNEIGKKILNSFN